MRRIYSFIKNRYAPRGAKISFAASGEDLIMADLLNRHVDQPKKISYVDIGAHDPIFGNNTYLFYKNGGQGVVIEPNEKLYRKNSAKRPGDICILAGAGPINSKAVFYLFPQSTRSTFSKEQSLKWQTQSGQKPKEIVIPTLSLDTIIEKLNGQVPDIVSIDTEGYDLSIIRTFSWRLRPKIFCVETLLTEDFNNEKTKTTASNRNQELYRLFSEHQYLPRAETSANTIFYDALIQ